MTDSDGFNAFFHVLIFYEEINEAEISLNDFDIVTEILRKQHLQKKKRIDARVHNNEESKSPLLGRDGSGGDSNELFKPYKKKMIDMHNRRKNTQL